MNIAQLDNYENKCTGCMICEIACPSKAITLSQNEEGFYRPQIAKKLCSHCGICIKVCPAFCDTQQNAIQKAYAAQGLDLQKLVEATSGGIFELLADAIFQEGGVVIGVVYDGNLVAKHAVAYDVSGIRKMNGSKYVQSYAGEGYRLAKECLDDGIKVLFSGTPCQIQGLLNYLGTVNESLITCDIPCYGVPSSKMFCDNKTYLEQRYKGTLLDFRFRDKHKNGFSHTTVMTFDTPNGLRKVTVDDYHKIPYHFAFSQRNCYQKSCYQCRYTQPNRTADITLGSFWGIEKLTDKFDIAKGVSMVLLNSAKGIALFNAIADKLLLSEQMVQSTFNSNAALVGPVVESASRDKMFHDYKRFGYNYICIKYYKRHSIRHYIFSYLVAVKRKLTSVILTK